jgi:predicted DCC family thiol-disulfide oxidoreductase YuxK
MKSIPGEPAGIILFDGECSLCNAAVAFVIARDARAGFRFAPLQSAAAASLLRESGGGGEALAMASAAPARLPDGRPDMWQSVVLIESGCVYLRSTAALRVLRRLGLPWSLLAIFLVVPAPLRDPIYRWIARHRFAWFGRLDTCMVPTEDLRARFIE